MRILILGLITAALAMSCNSDRNFGDTSAGPVWLECPVPGGYIELDEIARMVYYEEPEYPELARQAGLEGTVWVKALVYRDGSVVDSFIGKSSGTLSLDQAALDASFDCVFTPALFRGHPVCMWVTYQVEFRLD